MIDVDVTITMSKAPQCMVTAGLGREVHFRLTAAAGNARHPSNSSINSLRVSKNAPTSMARDTRRNSASLSAPPLNAVSKSMSSHRVKLTKECASIGALQHNAADAQRVLSSAAIFCRHCAVESHCDDQSSHLTAISSGDRVTAEIRRSTIVDARANLVQRAEKVHRSARRCRR
jgi:hypothetical protein